jgi:hypothetical protein
VPAAAVTPETGLYCEGHRLASLTNGLMVVSLPPAQSDRLALEVRSGTWLPRKVIPNSQDSRDLGVQVFALTLQSATAGDKVFRANDGQWQSAAAPAKP